MDPRPPEPKVKIDLTPAEQETEQSLENLPLINLQHKIFLILVWRKIKSASQLHFPADLSESQVAEIKNTFKKAGLFFRDAGVVQNKKLGSNPPRIFFVSNNEKDLDLISQLWFGDHINDPKVYREIGRMSDFPQTAIENYAKFSGLVGQEEVDARKKLTLSESEKKEMFPGDLYYFSLFFYMSREHWQSEINTVKKWMEELKLSAPVLYQSYIKFFKKNIET